MAERSDAPIHHKSGARILTPSILQLMRIGIQSLADNPELADTSIPSPSNAPDPRVISLLDRVRILEDKSLDGVQTAIDSAIEKAIAPIQLDLAELLGQVDKLRVSIDGRPQSSKPQASEKPKLAITKPAGEVGKVVDRLLKGADLLKAVRAEIAIGGTSSEIAERLLASGHGTFNSGPHSPAAISRFRAALAYLDNPETAAQADS